MTTNMVHLMTERECVRVLALFEHNELTPDDEVIAYGMLQTFPQLRDRFAHLLPYPLSLPEN